MTDNKLFLKTICPFLSENISPRNPKTAILEKNEILTNDAKIGATFNIFLKNIE